MRISKPDEPQEELPLEVQLWLNKGWTIIPTERRGVVLVGPKSMQGRTMFLIGLGVILLAAAFTPLPHNLAWAGVALIVLGIVDYRFGTKAPTKFFPAAGDKMRSMER